MSIDELTLAQVCNDLLRADEADAIRTATATAFFTVLGVDAVVRANGARDAQDADLDGALLLPMRSRGGSSLGGVVVRTQPARLDDDARLAATRIVEHAAIALERAMQLADAREARAVHERRTRHAAMALKIGVALTNEEGARPMLQQVCESIVEQLDAAFARVWTTNEHGTVLELQASAGMYTHIDGGHARVPVGAFKIGKVASEREPHLTNDVQSDARVGDPAWARREGMVSFAGYPLIDGERVVGVMALFARQPLPQDTLDALAVVADSVALGVVRLRAVEERTRRARQLRGLQEAALAVGAATDAQELMSRTARHALELVGASGVAVLAEDEHEVTEGDALAPVAATAEMIGRDGRRLGRIDVRSREALIPGDADVVGQLGQLAAAALDNLRLIAVLARANRELDQFAYVASHDLKAPLRGIANLAQWLEEDIGAQLSGESKENMVLLKGRVQRMEALIDGILAFSRAGRIEASPERVDVGALVREIVEVLAPPAEARIVIDEDLPTFVTEKVQLQQVFLNLIANALKYGKSEQAAAHIRVVGVRRPGAGGAWEMAVIDDGPGIAPQYHERVWGIFQRLEARDRVEGTGIGLAIVKKIVEARGGRAWIDSSQGHGAAFRFLWPVRA